MIYAKKLCRALILFSALFLLSAGMSYAFDDGFGSAKKIEGKNIIVYVAPDVNISSLNKQLDIRPSDKILAGKTTSTKTNPEEELADMLDTLFVKVCDITDMRLYDLQVNIKVCRDKAQLDSVYANLFNSGLGDRRSFYVYSFNTIFISADSFTKEIIGHEMAHAVICRYFVVPPPIKIQEVLAMYVEYNLRRSDVKLTK